MTEYWKSNARKFCDYCKCWFADNRPSIDFHESGKKHKENVAKRLQEIGRRGKEDYDNSLRIDDYMREMEQAALKAYRQDIGDNPDLTGSAIAEMAKEKNADLTLKTDKDEKPPPSTADTKWREAKSSDGRSYYYHADTKATKWDPPPDGYISLKEQKVLKAKKKSKKKKDKDSDHSKKEKKQSPGESSEVKPSEPRVTPAQPETTITPAYNSWVTVEEPVIPDLQLPKVAGAEDYDEDDYINFPKPAPHQFTQKILTLGESSTGTGFKKRKNCEVIKKNARMRNNDL